MAAFPKMTLTNAGQALQTKVLAGAQLTFTRIALGDGQLNDQPVSLLTDMIHQTASVEVDTVRVMSASTCQVAGFFSNATISAGFQWRETGLFAQDPDAGEILYGYTNAGGAGDYIPTVQDTRIEKYIYCSVAVANAPTVNITIPSTDTYIPVSEKGVAGGVPTLDSSGKVPASQLPEMDYISSDEKGKENGVATLGADGKLSDGQVPDASKVPYESEKLPSAANVKQALDSLQASVGKVEDAVLTYGQQTVQTTAWTEDQTLVAAGYGYRAPVPLEGMTGSHVPTVNFSASDASSGNMAPVADSYDGGVYIFAKAIPEAAVTIVSVEGLKGVNT